MTTQRRRDLTAEQAAVLRPLVERLCEGRGAMARLTEVTGWSHPNILAFRRGGQGLSYAVALKVCELADQDAFALLGLPRPAHLRALDIPADEFLMRIAIAPGLSETLSTHPRRWYLSTVVQGLKKAHPTDTQGVPVGGWASLLDSIQPPRAADGASNDAAPAVRRRRAKSTAK